MKKKRLVIISNRLPIKVNIKDEQVVFTKSEGGLATGLDSLETDYERHWIGWPGIFPENSSQKESITKLLQNNNITPVYLSPDQIQNFYEGYSNSTLWPLCHYFFAYIQFDLKYWEAYQEVNKLFFEEAKKTITDDDIVWVHDYQLMLLPAMIRECFSTIRIGYFLHIPFPSYELFRVLPERDFLLKGILGADLIGFHTNDYMRHFISSIYRILGIECKINQISFGNRVVHVDSFPMGINFDNFFNAVENKLVVKCIKGYRKQFGKHRIILSVDRLDYSKGLLHRLKAFDSFLADYPQFRKKVSLVMVVVPSRDTVEKYQDLKIKLDETIGAINGKYSDLAWIPVYYFYRGLPCEELAALYNFVDIALVTPLRDGMNLVAKEFVASRRDKTGVLILSEMTGASVELLESLKVNPNNIGEIKQSIYLALTMSEQEQKERMEKMQQVIKKQDVFKWADDFINELLLAGQRQDEINEKALTYSKIENLRRRFSNASNRLLLLDYDGTLAPFVNDPEKAAPEPALYQLLEKLVNYNNTTVAIISGRDYTTLGKWFPDRKLVLFSEHGAYYRDGDVWVRNYSPDKDWQEEILSLFQKITDKTPGSFSEIKNSAIVWHFRKSDSWLAELREKQLIESLVYPCSKLNLQIMRGSKIVEVKEPGVNKGICALQMLKKQNWDFIVSIGDDTTDEDMFRELPAESVTIKVGKVSENAALNLASHREVLKLLKIFIS